MAQPFGARALEELEVIGVENDAARAQGPAWSWGMDMVEGR